MASSEIRVERELSYEEPAGFCSTICCLDLLLQMPMDAERVLKGSVSVFVYMYSKYRDQDNGRRWKKVCSGEVVMAQVFINFKGY